MERYISIEEYENNMKIKMNDVFGTDDNDRGMIVADSEENCPIFKDKVPYKSVSVVCDMDDEDEVQYWLIYVYGGGCISKRKELKDNKVALRSDYQCW